MNDLEEKARRFGIALGYHDVFGRWHAAPRETLECLLQSLGQSRDGPPPSASVAPGQVTRAYQGDGRRDWVLTVQLYGLRSAHNWGIGDFTDLAALVRLAAARGAGAVGLNPLHALFSDRPEQASPYAPNSRLFVNSLLIDVEAIPEFPGLAAAGLVEEVARLRQAPLIEYAGVGAAKLKGLRLAYEGFVQRASVERRADFQAYRREQGEALLRFSCFEALRARHGATLWPQWPSPWRRPALTDLERFRADHARQCEFHEFLQWNADRQLAFCQRVARDAGMPVGLYIDLAVGIDPMGADAWAQQDAVMTGISVGAPPDEFNPAGQDWGLAPFNPFTVAADDFGPMRGLMRSAMRHAGAIRLDHVLGLKRLYLIPHGAGAAGGTYVDFPFEPLLSVIAEESNRHRCIVIGEDLGTVPEGFRDVCARFGVWTYRVVMFERDHEGRFRPPESYPEDSLTGFNTHDLPTFSGWLSMHDLAVKRAIGVDPGENEDGRRHAHAMLREMLAQRAPGEAPDDIAAVAAFLAATPSRLVAVSLEDALGDIEQVNVPGTIDQHPNWRRKSIVALEDLGSHAGFQRLGDAFRRGGRAAT